MNITENQWFKEDFVSSKYYECFINLKNCDNSFDGLITIPNKDGTILISLGINKIWKPLPVLSLNISKYDDIIMIIEWEKKYPLEQLYNIRNQMMWWIDSQEELEYDELLEKCVEMGALRDSLWTS